MDTTTLAVIVGAVLFLAGGGYVLRRRRGERRRAEAEAYYYFRCPGCRRRLRFQARQAGRKGKCSNCGQEVTFPPISQSVD